MGRRWWVVAVAVIAGVTALVYPSDAECTARASRRAPGTSAAPPHPAAPRTAEAPAPDLSAAVARPAVRPPGWA
ncbi:hypothetical protein [Saccharothrix carnea]|uniref:hypothetical protein n=1 Tax=Saccharothrix carnea TaxID=1280637 RepID=UPI0011B23ABE|nr:hypothetical protein [Saccharothrix carnea]